MQWKEVEKFHIGFTNRTFMPGRLGVKQKELIALAVALSIGCEDEACYRQHMKRAKEYGVTKEEIAETASVVMAMAGCIVGSLARRKLGLFTGNLHCGLPEEDDKRDRS